MILYIIKIVLQKPNLIIQWNKFYSRARNFREGYDIL